MKFSQYINESIWTKKKAIQFIADMEPAFLKSNIIVEIVGSIKEKGESENDLDLFVTRSTPKSHEKLVKELNENKETFKIERIDEDKNVVTLLLKPDRKVVDIIFNDKETK